MAQIRDEVSDQGKSFGIDVIDVRIRRADLPEENSQAIFCPHEVRNASSRRRNTAARAPRRHRRSAPTPTANAP